MRIIAGRFRRRKLIANPGETTRPITDRVKEALFENIQKRVEGKRVADIFAGTGTIGLEALSRGAARVTFIEKDRIAVELLRENVAHLECQAETLIWPADVIRCSYRPKGERVDEFTPWDTVSSTHRTKWCRQSSLGNHSGFRYSDSHVTTLPAQRPHSCFEFRNTLSLSFRPNGKRSGRWLCPGWSCMSAKSRPETARLVKMPTLSSKIQISSNGRPCSSLARHQHELSTD